MFVALFLIAGACFVIAGGLQIATIYGQHVRDHDQRQQAVQQQARQAAELAGHYQRACQALHHRRPAWQGWREMLVFRIEQVAIDCKSFYLRDPDCGPLPTFQPGQFLTVGLRDADGPLISRCYSLSAAPDGRYYRITVKRLAEGKVSTRLHDTVQVGDTLVARAPGGQFVADTNPDVPLHLIAAGIGITPMVSLARHYQTWQPQRIIQLFYQVRQLDQAPLLDELAKWAAANPRVRLYVYLSGQLREKPAWAAGLGRLTGDEIMRRSRINMYGEEDTASIPHGQFMLCGPLQMLEQLHSELVDLGVSTEHITYETFGGPPAAKKIASADGGASGQAVGDGQAVGKNEFAVELTRSGQTVLCTPAHPTILAAAESQGVSLEAGCRAGDCGSCLVRKLAGEVRYLTTPGYGPIGDDEVLACLAEPITNTTIEA
ncbi:2Fe-2S iron-sulfur cluster-binding protein [Planctomycetaceae bacterium SH139]